MHVVYVTAMALFSVALTPSLAPDTIEVTYALDHTFNDSSAKVDSSALSIPLCPNIEPLKQMDVTMHKSPCKAYDMGEYYNEWFSRRLGFEVKLLYIGKNRRKVLGNIPPVEEIAKRVSWKVVIMFGVAPLEIAAAIQLRLKASVHLTLLLATLLVVYLIIGRKEMTSRKKSTVAVNEGISFADLAPYLVISRRSWQNVQERLPDGETMDITKFRANIVVDGADEAFDEDFWAELQISDRTRMSLTQNCARCASVNVDYTTGKPGTGAAGKVLKLLSSYRRVDPGSKWSPVFGRYGFLAPLHSSSVDDRTAGVVINVGDEIQITRRNEDRMIMGRLSTFLLD